MHHADVAIILFLNRLLANEGRNRSIRITDKKKKKCLIFLMEHVTQYIYHVLYLLRELIRLKSIKNCLITIFYIFTITFYNNNRLQLLAYYRHCRKRLKRKQISKWNRNDIFSKSIHCSSMKTNLIWLNIYYYLHIDGRTITMMNFR